MKKYSIILIVLFLLCACFVSGSIVKDSSSKPRVVKLFGCEYIEYTLGESTTLIHKGNCKYCENKYEEELSEIIKILKKIDKREEEKLKTFKNDNSQ